MLYGLDKEKWVKHVHVRMNKAGLSVLLNLCAAMEAARDHDCE